MEQVINRCCVFVDRPIPEYVYFVNTIWKNPNKDIKTIEVSYKNKLNYCGPGQHVDLYYSDYDVPMFFLNISNSEKYELVINTIKSNLTNHCIIIDAQRPSLFEKKDFDFDKWKTYYMNKSDVVMTDDSPLIKKEDILDIETKYYI